MHSASGRYVISYNGRCIISKELKKDLEDLGCKFKSATDTEVIVNAIEKWGIGAISRFNGMFAFALWDKKKDV